MLSLDELTKVWPIINSVALCALAVMSVLVRGQLARLTAIERLLGQLQNTLQNLNLTLTELKASYLGHVNLDEARFQSIEHRLDAQRLSFESLREHVPK